MTTRDRRPVVRPFLRYAWAERWIYAAGAAAIVAANVLDVGLSRAMGLAIAEVEAGAPADRALGLAGAIVLVAAGLFVLQGALRNLVFLAGRRIERNLRRDLAAKILRLPAEIRDRYHTGDLASRLVNDVSDIRMFMGAGYLQVVNTALAFGLSFALMFHLEPVLAAWSLLPYPFLVLAARRFTRATHERSLAAQEALGLLTDRAHEGIAGIEVVKAYRVEAWRAAVLGEAASAYRGANLSLARAEAAWSAVVGSGVPFGVVVVLAVGGRRLVDGLLPLDALVTFVLLLMRLAYPAIALGWVTNVLQRGLAAMRRVLEILEAPDRAAGRPPPRRIERPSGPVGVEVRGLRFAYPSGGPEVLRGLDLRIAPGEHLGIAGPTASGKSTLLAVLAGEYDPPAGTVFVGGVDALEWPIEDLRRTVGLAAQRPHLFSMRLEENLRLGRPDAERTEIDEAVRAAALETDLRDLPEGIATPVGERGITLSGGQRARAAVARALLADPPVLLLDDPCAAVDLSTEATIRARVRRARAGKTTVIVSQRLSMLSSCDRIAVISGGRVLEEGRHEDLVRRGGWYADAWEAETIRRELSA